ncbi:MAG: hypothetical protein KGI38_09095 [Thaumarchaeota archaeon]|nr:hypothetical protein [Nitrososphaerota archaeon]
MGQKFKLGGASAIAVLVAASVALGAVYAYPLNPSTIMTTKPPLGPLMDCGGATLCTAQNPSGLLLTLAINESEVKSNGAFIIGISEYNPTTQQINMSRSNEWQIQGLSWGPCDGGTYPFGIAIFRGYYTLSNISGAKNVLTYGMEFCVFHPDETAPSINPMSSLSPQSLPDLGQVYAMQGSTLNAGNFTSSVNSIGSNKPGVYTVVAGDEWGDIAILHFYVKN